LILADQIRGDLAARFGPSLRARTTEEITTDLHVKEVLGADHFEPLIRLLSVADQLKFAALPEYGDEQAIHDEVAAWTTLRGSLTARLSVQPEWCGTSCAPTAGEPKSCNMSGCSESGKRRIMV
jgi:hypothetical protein